MNVPKISVVVCVYNGEEVLEACLTSLEEQDADKSLYEVIIIDNNSTDRTNEIAASFVSKNQNFSLHKELEVGLSAARNRGYKEARAEYIGYIDDDGKASTNWISTAFRIIETHKPDIFGGPIYPYYVGEKAEWYQDKYGEYSVYEQEGWISKGTYLSGSNIFFHKQFLEEIQGFNTSIGMSGNELGYHEETAVQNKAHELGKKVFYSLELFNYHIVSKIKQNILFALYSNYKSGRDGIKVWEGLRKLDNLFELIQKLDSFMSQIKTAVIELDQEKYKFPENYVYEVLSSLLFDIGFNAGLFLDEKKIENVFFLEYLIKERQIEIDEILTTYQVYTGKIQFTSLTEWYLKQKPISEEDLKLFVKSANDMGYKISYKKTEGIRSRFFAKLKGMYNKIKIKR